MLCYKLLQLLQHLHFSDNIVYGGYGSLGRLWHVIVRHKDGDFLHSLCCVAGLYRVGIGLWFTVPFSLICGFRCIQIAQAPPVAHAPLPSPALALVSTCSGDVVLG